MNAMWPFFVAVLISDSALAQSPGPQRPTHAQHSYSFTCPSGASGHMNYTEDSPGTRPAQLSIWVNGQYIHAESRITAALKGRAIDELRGGCDGEKTYVLVEVSDQPPAGGTHSSWITVLVDLTGHVTWVGV
jgi:hypothetical protein